MELKYKRGDVCCLYINKKPTNVVVIGSCFGRVDQEYTTVCRFNKEGDKLAGVYGRTILIKGIEHNLLSKLPEKKEAVKPKSKHIAKVISVEGEAIK